MLYSYTLYVIRAGLQLNDDNSGNKTAYEGWKGCINIPSLLSKIFKIWLKVLDSR